jgi:hypothetical protein
MENKDNDDDDYDILHYTYFVIYSVLHRYAADFIFHIVVCDVLCVDCCITLRVLQICCITALCTKINYIFLWYNFGRTLKFFICSHDLKMCVYTANGLFTQFVFNKIWNPVYRSGEKNIWY